MLEPLKELAKKLHNHAKLEVVIGNNFDELSDLMFMKGSTPVMALF